ncbi:MAG: DegT/DnrJ/EryC1/StrS family aminotransferase [Flavobacteriales bacterium]|nr:DegT/DnrJ/EryC1/StrS family aminotransferase [Flavobacteriales bacterium]
MADRINVTKTHLPPLDEYQRMIGEIWKSGQLTNVGAKHVELQNKLKEYLGVKHLQLVSNGTIAIQLAIKALGLTGEIITTPFSYVATVSSIVWENCSPVFVDIDRDDFCVDATKIEAAITENTSAILATHVYGIPCNVELIQEIADRHNLKVIYDAAHAFSIELDGKSLLNYGDVSTLSFHATKVFHTGEGGAVVTDNDELAHKLWYHGNFGHRGPEEFWGLGINAKMSEIHAALGLCILPCMDEILRNRKKTVVLYDKIFTPVKSVKRLDIKKGIKHNYSYYPVVFDSEETLLSVLDALQKLNIYPRRYFYPSLNKLPYLHKHVEMPVAEDISRRILCLPLSSDHNADVVNTIGSAIIDIVK